MKARKTANYWIGSWRMNAGWRETSAEAWNCEPRLFVAESQINAHRNFRAQLIGVEEVGAEEIG